MRRVFLQFILAFLPFFKPWYHLNKTYGECMLQTLWKLQMHCLSSLHSALEMSRLPPLALCPSDLCSRCLPSTGNWSSRLLAFRLVCACVPACVHVCSGNRERGTQCLCNPRGVEASRQCLSRTEQSRRKQRNTLMPDGADASLGPIEMLCCAALSAQVSLHTEFRLPFVVGIGRSR